MPSRDDLGRQIVDLLRETGRAHHEAFRQTDGEDPEWPLWYAGYLQERLGRLLNVRLTKSELVYLLVTAEREQAAQDPQTDWPVFYARLFLERYA